MTHPNFSKCPEADFKKLLELLRYLGSLYPMDIITPSSEDNTYSELHPILDVIFRSFDRLRTAIYFARYEAATMLILRHRLSLPYTTTNRIVHEFHNVGLIKPITEFKAGKRPVRVWAIPEARPEKVQEAILEHKRLSSPKYQLAENLVQTILTKLPRPEITYRDIVIHIRELRIPYQSTDIADLIAWELQKRGVRVWR